MPREHDMTGGPGEVRRSDRRNRRLMAVAGATVLAGAVGWPGVAAADTAPPADLTTITADDLPTWQTDGVVWSVAVVNGMVFVGGNFDAIRPPGASPGDGRELPRKGLAAFDAATGEPFDWAPTVEGTPFTSSADNTDCDKVGDNRWVCDAVWEIKPSPDGSTIYVGGDFAKIDGQWRSKIAAFDTGSGALTPFKRAVSNRVKALAVTDSTVYAGGSFGSVDGNGRQRLAAFRRTDGALLDWRPTADRSVLAMVMSPDGSRVVLGGDFNKINGGGPHGLGAVYAGSGQSAPWKTGVAYTDNSRRSVVTDLVADGDTVYASADGVSTFDGRLALDPGNGEQRWIDNCAGATQALTLMGDVLYSGSHAHNCSSQPDGFPELRPNNPTHQRLLAEPAKPTTSTPKILHWFPNTNGGPTIYNQGPRALDNDGRYLWLGGDFTTVNSKGQQGLTRFASLDVAKDVNPPQPFSAPSVTRPQAGQLKVSWKATWDRDNRRLTYEVIRDGKTVVQTMSADSVFWDLQAMTFTDTGLTPGTGHTYSIRAKDSFGNNFRTASSGQATA